MPTFDSQPERSADEELRIRRAYALRDADQYARRTYSYANPAYHFHMQELEWEILRVLRAAKLDLNGSRVLEIGCGFGHILQRLVEFGAAEATGIDLMEPRLEEARRRYPTIDFVRANAAELPLDSASFDVVTQFVCLSSVLDANVRARIAREMWRVLRPGGMLLSYDLRPPLSRRLGRTVPIDQTPTTGLGRAELRRLFGDGGEPDVRAVTLNFSLAPLAARSRALARLLAMIPPLRSHLLLLARKPAG